MLSDDTQKRIKAIRDKVEDVGEAFGIPHDQAAALLIVYAVEQGTQQAAVRASAKGKVWAWFKGLLSHGAETAKQIRID